MSVRRDTRLARGFFARGMIGLAAVLAAVLGLAGCASSSKAAPANATAKTLPAASARVAAARLPSVDAGIKVYANCKTPSVEPAEIVLACADYNALLESLHWTSWTATSATAVGTFVYNDCTPNCADGHFRHVPGTRVTLTVPSRTSGGQRVWSLIQENPEPPGYETGPFHGGPQPLPKEAI
jgi:hypothetical protein